jgi:acylphosphatase
MKHINIKISGRVQGVLFRDAARRNGKKLDLTGFVRNDVDGSVYIEAEGEEENLEKFLAWCRRGPPFARVDDVQIEPSKTLKNYEDFMIQY